MLLSFSNPSLYITNTLTALLFPLHTSSQPTYTLAYSLHTFAILDALFTLLCYSAPYQAADIIMYD